MNRTAYLFLLVVVLGIASFGCSGQVESKFPQEELVRYNSKHLPAYLELSKKGEHKAKEADIKGKKVLLMLPEGARKGGPYLHEEFGELPSDVKASNPSEVEIVILCFPRTRVTGKYLGGGEGYRITTNMYCFDALSGEFKGYKKARGEMPPSEVESGASKEERTGKSLVVETVVELAR